MLKTAGKLAPEAKPRVVNMLFQAFFVYSRVVYSIFPHTFSEKWHLRQDRREGMCHFRLGYEEKIIVVIILISFHFCYFYTHEISNCHISGSTGQKISIQGPNSRA